MATKLVFSGIIIVFFTYGFLKIILLLTSLDRDDIVSKENKNLYIYIYIYIYKCLFKYI